MAIKRMRAESELGLVEVRRRMDAMGERDLEVWVSSGPLPAAVLEALGWSPVAGNLPRKSTAVSARNQVVPKETGEPRDDVNPVGAGPDLSLSEKAGFVAWHHLQLLPGLMLQLSANASPAVSAAAKRICEEYLGA